MSIFKPKTFTLPNGKLVVQPRSRTPFIILAVAAVTYFSVFLTGFNFAQLVSRIDQFFVILFAMFPPRFAFMHRVWGPLFDTIKMSILGSVMGALLAVPAAVVASGSVIKNKAAVHSMRIFLSGVRTLPTLVIALVATFVLGLGTLAGTIAITLFTFAYIGKQLYELLETVDLGAYEAMQATGLKRVPSVWLAISPQIMPVYIATVLFCLEGNVRHAAILGWVGAGGIGLILNERIQFRDYDAVGMIILSLFVIVALIEILSYFIRKKLT